MIPNELEDLRVLLLEMVVLPVVKMLKLHATFGFENSSSYLRSTLIQKISNSENKIFVTKLGREKTSQELVELHKGMDFFILKQISNPFSLK